MVKGLKRKASTPCPQGTLGGLEMCDRVDGQRRADRGTVYFRCKDHMNTIACIFTGWGTSAKKKYCYKVDSINKSRLPGEEGIFSAQGRVH